MNKTVLYWLLRKALYTVVGALMTGLVAYMLIAGGPDYDFQKVTMAGAIGAVTAAVVGDLRRKLFPDFLQIVTGEDPRVDG